MQQANPAGYSIRPATPADLPAILAIFEAAKREMHAAGIPQWQNGYPDEATLRGDMQKGGSFVLCSGAEILGTAALLLGEEPTYQSIYEGAWPGGDKPYATLHRVAVARAAKGTGAAMAFYTLLEEWCRNQPVHSIRVDTHRANQPMRAFLAKCGFTQCGIIYLQDGAERLAFEKHL